MIFIQLVVCFLSPHLGSGIGKTINSLDKNHTTSQTMGDPLFITQYLCFGTIESVLFGDGSSPTIFSDDNPSPNKN
jgi:hypothetical protein